jgi:flagellar biosynthesis GTPase FlhF
MNQTQALAKARKLLGPKAGIRINSGVPVGEEREAQFAKRRALTEALKALKEARDARQREVLAADAEYQRLRSEAQAMEKERDGLCGAWSRRVTILVNRGFANEVVAEGDNLDEAIAALEAKKGGAA